MKKEIELIESNLTELKRKYELQERMDYERAAHKVFTEGDIVRKDDMIGIVGWTENDAINCPSHAGYMGVSLITGTRGFLAPTRRDEWDIVNDPYYRTNYKINIELTGLEIEDLLYYIGPQNFNPNESKSKLIDILKSFKK